MSATSAFRDVPSASIRDVRTKTAVVDGLSMFYREAGAVDAPAIVLLHGFPSSSHMFRNLIPRLADRFRVIAPDYVGFGYSDAPDASSYEYTFDNLTAGVQALLDQLRVHQAILYMQDYGGPIGMRIATANPERVSGLIFQNANAYLEGISPAATTVFMPLWEKDDETGARLMLQPEMTKYQYTAGARQPEVLSPDTWTLNQALLDRPGSQERHMSLFKDYQSNVVSYDAWQAYFRAIQPKTLVVWGKRDPFFTTAGAESFKRDLKDIHVQYFETGHFALEEDADSISHAIKQRF